MLLNWYKMQPYKIRDFNWTAAPRLEPMGLSGNILTILRLTQTIDMRLDNVRADPIDLN